MEESGRGDRAWTPLGSLAAVASLIPLASRTARLPCAAPPAGLAPASENATVAGLDFLRQRDPISFWPLQPAEAFLGPRDQKARRSPPAESASLDLPILASPDFGLGGLREVCRPLDEACKGRQKQLGSSPAQKYGGS